MESHRAVPSSDTPRVVLLALAFFGALASVAWADGVFDRLDVELRWALALFATGYAAFALLLDRELRAWARAALRLRKAPARSPGGKRAAT
jgi:hypothetical protein